MLYDLAKSGLQYYGYYDQIKQYDPGYYLEKYKYKTGKRITSKVAQELQKGIRSAKRRNVPKYYKQYQKCAQRTIWNYCYNYE